jgi:hypothetical protein
MPTLIKNEGPYTAEFLLSEGNGYISRESIVVEAGDALFPGQILGLVTASGKYNSYVSGDPDGTGVGVAVGILYAPIAESDEDRKAVAIVRMAEVSRQEIGFIDDAAVADLAARNIIVRD